MTKIIQPIGRVDVFIQAFNLPGYWTEREEENPYHIAFWIYWQGLSIGAIHLRSVEDNLTEISPSDFDVSWIVIEELPVLKGWRFGVEDISSRIRHLAEWIDETKGRSSFIYDQEFKETFKVRSHDLGRLLLPIRLASFGIFKDRLWERIKQEWGKSILEHNQEVPEKGRASLDQNELDYRLRMAEHAEQIKLQHPEKTLKEICREINWDRGSTPASRIKLLQDAMYRLGRERLKQSKMERKEK